MSSLPIKRDFRSYIPAVNPSGNFAPFQIFVSRQVTQKELSHPVSMHSCWHKTLDQEIKWERGWGGSPHVLPTAVKPRETNETMLQLLHHRRNCFWKFCKFLSSCDELSIWHFPFITFSRLKIQWLKWLITTWKHLYQCKTQLSCHIINFNFKGASKPLWGMIFWAETNALSCESSVKHLRENQSFQ